MIRKAIAAYLKKRGITQAWLAKETGISPVALSQILNSKQNLDIDDYVKICDALGVPYDAFIISRGQYENIAAAT